MGHPRGEILGAIRHINYELIRLAELPSAFDRAKFVTRDQPTTSATFEAALLHLRNLMEFLTNNSDIRLMRAAEFAGGGWNPDASEPLTRMRPYWGLINAHVSHLGWDRVTRVQESAYADWPIREFAYSVIDAFAEFVDTIEDIELRGGFAAGLAEARGKLGHRSFS